MSNYLVTSMSQENKDESYDTLKYSSSINQIEKTADCPSSDFYNASLNTYGKNQAEDVSKELSQTDSFCHLKLDSLIKLKESTRKLLCVLEEIQLKTHSKQIKSDGTPKLLNLLKPIPPSSGPTVTSVTNILGASALKQLENKTSILEGIYIQDENDDCSIYKRLTRKCNCLNKPEYNDFVILFNEETKYFKNSLGEIIKNMRILKKFLYMTGDYTKHALLFLNEAFTQSTYTEKVEIIQGCAYADICNVFDEYSIAIVCISWPCKYPNYGDSITQELTANFLHKLVQLEEGRRYLNLSTKITNDIKKIMRKRASKLEFETLQILNIILNKLQPSLYHTVNATYYCKPVDEDYLGSRTIHVLEHNRKQMTLDEVIANLEMLNNYSTRETGKIELTSYLPALIKLFMNMLMEFDNSTMNIVITNILNNIVAKNLVKEKEKEKELPKTVIIADIATEPIKMKNEYNQIPVKSSRKNKNKSKSKLGLSPNKMRNPSKRAVASLEPSKRDIEAKKEQVRRSYLRNSIIVVPTEKIKTNI